VKKSSGSEKTSPRKSLGGEDMEDYDEDFPEQKLIAAKKFQLLVVVMLKRN